MSVHFVHQESLWQIVGLEWTCAGESMASMDRLSSLGSSDTLLRGHRSVAGQPNTSVLDASHDPEVLRQLKVLVWATIIKKPLWFNTLKARVWESSITIQVKHRIPIETNTILVDNNSCFVTHGSKPGNASGYLGTWHSGGGLTMTHVDSC